VAKKDTPNLEELQAQIDELTSDLQRVSADFANYKRRAGDEQQQMSTMVKSTVVAQLLPLFDNLERALTHMPADLQDNQWAKGVTQLAKQFEDTLKKLGVTRIPAKGQLFDPHLHEAVSYEDDGEGDEVVVEELQSGYQLNDHVVRHTMVKVGHRSTVANPEEVMPVLETQKSEEVKEKETTED
jgi:molecular chaperone GrpE